MADEPTTPDLSTLTFSRSAAYRSFSSDFHRVRIGHGIVYITFSKTTHEPSLSSTANIVEEQAEVAISWVLLKMIASNLAGIVDAIEQEMGNIPVPSAYQINRDRNRELVKSLGLVGSSSKIES